VGNRLDQAGVIALHVIDAHAHWPADHVIERIRVGVKRELQSDTAQSIVSGERSSVRERQPEFEQLALLVETAAVENRSVALADRGICRWPRDRR